MNSLSYRHTEFVGTTEHTCEHANVGPEVDAQAGAGKWPAVRPLGRVTAAGIF